MSSSNHRNQTVSTSRSAYRLRKFPAPRPHFPHVLISTITCNHTQGVNDVPKGVFTRASPRRGGRVAVSGPNPSAPQNGIERTETVRANLRRGVKISYPRPNKLKSPEHREEFRSAFSKCRNKKFFCIGLSTRITPRAKKQFSRRPVPQSMYLWRSASSVRGERCLFAV